MLVGNTVPELSVAVGSCQLRSAAVSPGKAFSEKLAGQSVTIGRSVSVSVVAVCGVVWCE